MTRTTWLVLLFLLAGLLLAMGIVIGRNRLGKAMTFEVTVPTNTPEGDLVYLYLHHQATHRMTQVKPFRWRLRLTEAELRPEEGQIKYRYSRNGYEFRTAEYLEPDTSDYFWTEKGRSTSFAPGKTQRDGVLRWRWFPDGPLPQQTTGLEPSGQFLARINGQPFRSGVIIEDLYVDAFRPFFEPTAKHLGAIGFGWVEIDPPWQLLEVNGVPQAVNLTKDNPNYPDDATLLEEIRSYKDQGLKVMLGPQLCCETIDFQNRSQAWWDSYFAETTRFLVHHATLAQTAGVDALHYAVSTDYEATDRDERWRGVFQAIQDHFSGQVGEMVWNFGSESGKIIPNADYIHWGDLLDYFYIALDAPLALTDQPTDQILKQGVVRLLDGELKTLSERYQKPVFVRTTYFAVKETWRGNEFYAIDSIPSVESAEAELTNSRYQYGPDDQARVINAYFQAIAERPWVIGLAQFGYEHWVNPLLPSLSIRGKPTETLWQKWHQVIE